LAEATDGTRTFPEGFLWGVATSAYQIEGAVTEDGRGASIWDTYAHTPGTIRNGDDADVANDHYHRSAEDVALMASIGVQAYRFSISWPRIFPEGGGEPNPKGIDFYQRLVDELLAAGIRPFPTLYHWDLPQALQDTHGGWSSRETVEAFAAYAGYVASQLGDRVADFITLNEIHAFVELGHRGVEEEIEGRRVSKEHAPGLKLPPSELRQVRHHAVLAHGLAVQAIRANAPSAVRCGFAENIDVAVPAVATPESVAVAETATRELNAGDATVMLEGRYPDAYLEAAGADAPRFTDDELRTISTPLDFVGLNLYRPAVYVLPADDAPGYRAIPFNESHPRMGSTWQVLGPEVLFWGPRHVRSLWDPASILITENGCATADVVAEDGQVYDTDRVMFLRASLSELQRATADGVPVDGYFLWSAQDNFEWAEGFAERFGIIHVDFETQRRTPKLSASWFREAAARNAVV
jgi:beta-glucosidase